MIPDWLPTPFCARCSPRTGLIRFPTPCEGLSLVQQAGTVVFIARCHGQKEETRLPAALVGQAMRGKIRILPGYAFQGRSW